MAKVPSAYIETVGATRTRTVDRLTFPFLGRPQAMTLYVRFVERGAFFNGDNLKIAVIGSSGNDTFQVDVDADPTPRYRLGVANLTVARATAFSTGAVPTVGQTVEVCANWLASGAVTGYLSIAGGTQTTAAPTAALTRTQAFTVKTIALGQRASTAAGGTAIRDVLVVRGVHSLATMRTRLGLTR